MASNHSLVNAATAAAQKAQAAPVDLSSQSVAGEEDPGASMDLVQPPKAPAQQAAAGTPPSDPLFQTPTGTSPGDEAPEGTPGTGESICRVCGGSGQAADAVCTRCGGLGKVIAGLGGG